MTESRKIPYRIAVWINLRLDLIPKEYISAFQRQDGSVGHSVRVCVGKKKAKDAYGNDCYVAISQTQSERQESEGVPYCGAGRIMWGHATMDGFEATVDISIERIRDYISEFPLKSGRTGTAVNLFVETMFNEDKYGNEIRVTIPQKREQREAKERKVGVGYGYISRLNGKFLLDTRYKQRMKLAEEDAEKEG